MAVLEMRLHPIPFELIKSGAKNIEIRLNDEKRQQMKLGDVLEFSLRPEPTEKFQAEIIGLDTFKTFKDVYAAYLPKQYGAESAGEWEAMYKYYSPEDEARITGDRHHSPVSNSRRRPACFLWDTIRI